jgi:copper chaperone
MERQTSHELRITSYELRVPMSETLQLTVTGMTCGGCENAVSNALRQIDGVEDVTASHTAKLVGVTYDPAKVTRSMVKERIEALGYDVGPSPPE